MTTHNPIPSLASLRQNSMDLIPFDQVAGHATGPTNRIFVKDGRLYKPAVLNKQTNREVDFYQNILPQLPELQEFVPKFYGLEKISFEGEANSTSASELTFLVMEDLTANHPSHFLCAADIKMGLVTTDRYASDEKRKLEALKASATTTVSLGFRVCGMKVYKDGRGLVKYDRVYGKAITKDNVKSSAFETFFHNRAKPRVDVIPHLLVQLKKLLQFFETNSKYLFVGTSLLLIYDGRHEAEIKPSEDTVIVKMIDFAHVDTLDPPNTRDEGYITGLTNMIKILEEIHAADIMAPIVDAAPPHISGVNVNCNSTVNALVDP